MMVTQDMSLGNTQRALSSKETIEVAKLGAMAQDMQRLEEDEQKTILISEWAEEEAL
jgi:hypothetical protein